MSKQHHDIVAILVFALALAWWSPAYSDGHNNHIRIKGSDTLSVVAKEWGRIYSEQHSPLTIESSGGGSGNGIAALINGHVEIASTSRKLRRREKRLISKKSDKKPYAAIVGLDAVSVLVNKNNPVNGISLTQLAGIYGANGKYNKWSDLGITVPGCETGKIVRVSRKNNSGTYAFFRKTIFGKRAHFHRSLVSHSNSQKVVKHVADDPCAIGYSGMAFLNSSVKTLCVAQTTTKQGCVPPTASFTLSHKYPLSRPLFMYTLGKPQGNTSSFLIWVQSKEGQHILRKAGFVSPPNQGIGNK
jgi:phosphate transport system substrate-binding protein